MPGKRTFKIQLSDELATELILNSVRTSEDFSYIAEKAFRYYFEDVLGIEVKPKKRVANGNSKN